MSTYDLGNLVTISTTLTTASGALVDPATLTLSVTKPDGTFDGPYTLPLLTRDGMGAYHYDYQPTLPGHYVARWTSTGIGAGATFVEFDVRGLAPAQHPFGATVNGVRSLLPTALIYDVRPPNRESAITTSDVEAWLDDIGGEVASRLWAFGKLGTLVDPATGYSPQSLVMLRARGLVHLGTAARTDDALHPERTGRNSSSYGSALWARYDRGLEELAALVSSLTSTPDSGDGMGGGGGGDHRELATPPRGTFPPPLLRDGWQS